MQVKELMTRDVGACRPEESLNRAAQIMWERDCGVVPVVDGEQRVVGVLTDRDVCMAAYTRGMPLTSIPVGDIMSRDVQCCGPDDSVADAEAAMKQRRVRRLPVLDGDMKLAGMLSLNDIARRAAQDGGKKRDGLAAGEVLDTLATLCRPWMQPGHDGGAEAAQGSAKTKSVLVPRRSR